MKTLNFYDILGVSIFASDEEIKNAYLKKIKQYHPDTYSGNKREAENITASINEGYNVLKDKTKKQVYDEKYGFDKQREIFFAERQKQQKREKKIAEKKAQRAKKSVDENNYATEKQKQQQAKQEQQFNEQTKVDEHKIKTNFWTKQPKKDLKQKKHFVLTDEQRAMRRERITLDLIIISLLVITILLIIF